MLALQHYSCGSIERQQVCGIKHPRCPCLYFLFSFILKREFCCETLGKGGKVALVVARVGTKSFQLLSPKEVIMSSLNVMSFNSKALTRCSLFNFKC